MTKKAIGLESWVEVISKDGEDGCKHFATEGPIMHEVTFDDGTKEVVDEKTAYCIAEEIRIRHQLGLN